MMWRELNKLNKAKKTNNSSTIRNLKNNSVCVCMCVNNANKRGQKAKGYNNSEQRERKKYA